MSYILLTQNSGRIIGPIAKLLGYIMEGIFLLLDKIGIPNIGLAIILFTIVIYLILMPLTIKQQKFSKLSARMNPELQAIQAKYKGKNDNESMMAMQMETKAVYAKLYTAFDSDAYFVCFIPRDLQYACICRKDQGSLFSVGR